MFPHFVGALWKSIAPGLADHLWQSTLFAAAAALLTVSLRRNSARLRYAIWLAASLKFLLPFSLLVAAGSLFSWRHLPVAAGSGMHMVEVVGQPFTRPPVITPTIVSVPVAPGTLTQLLPLLLCIWLAGFVAVLSVWIARWLRVEKVLHGSTLVTAGREYSALRRLQAVLAATRSTKLMQSEASLEPGVFGIFRPVLLWPRSVSEHLDDAHLEAVIAHELCHVRRRDNLAAVLHMLVEAVFWFHPLVWWIGAQLIAERERACDEAVIELGSHRQTYAESILKVCEFCLSSPLTCVSGVTGADLKKRMVHIMTDRVVRKLNPARKLLLWTAGCLAIALPIAFGLLNATPSRADALAGNTFKFTSVSIKPHAADANAPGKVMSKIMMKPDGSFTAENVSLHGILQLAYRVQDTQLKGEPDWVKSEKYDIEAKPDAATADEFRKLPEEQHPAVGQRMLQQLLADYFKLSLHQESLDLPVYELTVSEAGPKLQKTDKRGFMQMGVGELSSQGTHLDLLSTVLAQRLGTTVVDKTGLQGNYAFNLQWTPDADEMARVRAAAGDVPLEMSVPGQPPHRADAPPLATALEQQLGLKLQSLTTRVPVLIIDHAEQPAQN